MARNSVIRVDFAAVEQIERSLRTQAEAAQASLSRLKRQSERLRQGGWVGPGAEAFFVEMDAEITPALQRAVEALYHSESATATIARLLGEAEAQAARQYAGSPVQHWWQSVAGVAGDWAELALLVKETAGIVAGSALLGVALTGAGLLTIKGPAWARDAFGLAKNLGHIRPENLAAHMWQRGTSPGLAGLVTLIPEWLEDVGDYGHQGPARMAAALTTTTAVQGAIAVLSAKGGALAAGATMALVATSPGWAPVAAVAGGAVLLVSLGAGTLLSKWYDDSVYDDQLVDLTARGFEQIPATLELAHQGIRQAVQPYINAIVSPVQAPAAP